MDGAAKLGQTDGNGGAAEQQKMEMDGASIWYRDGPRLAGISIDTVTIRTCERDPNAGNGRRSSSRPCGSPPRTQRGRRLWLEPSRAAQITVWPSGYLHAPSCVRCVCGGGRTRAPMSHRSALLMASILLSPPPPFPLQTSWSCSARVNP